MSHTAGMDAHSEQINTERLENVKTLSGQPEATGPLNALEDGLVPDQRASTDQRILDEIAASRDVSELLKVIITFY